MLHWLHELLPHFPHYGYVLRVRPKAMTACVIIGGLAPILWSHGAGADVMKRIATPMMGGVVTSTIMELLVYPAIFYLWRSQRLELAPTGYESEISHAKESGL